MRILGVFAHPDDESIVIGGTLARAAHEGHDTYLICATRGESSTAFDEEYVSFEDLAEVREKEFLNASRILDVKETYFLDYIDGNLSEVNTNEAVVKLISLIDKIKPDVILTFEPNGISYHKDHMTVHTWTMEAIQELGADSCPERIYWATVSKNMKSYKNRQIIGHDYDTITTKVNIDDYRSKKSEAIKAHRTQYPSFEKNRLIVNGELTPHFQHEYFIRVEVNGEPIKNEELESFIL